jgi:DNA-binding MarR family transcriptional regulator
MSESKRNVRIELTEEQRRQLEEATGKQATAIEFTAEELEERIAPVRAINM